MADVSGRCGTVLESYITTLHDGFEAVDVAKDRCLLVTPFRRPDGEMIQVEVQALADGGLRLSDAGDSIAYLHVNGLSVTRGVRDDAKKLARRFGVSLDMYELAVEVGDGTELGEVMHGMIQASIAVTDMIQKRRPYTRLRFADEVEAYLVGRRAVYDNEFRVRGAVQDHVIRFHADSGKRVLIQPLSPAHEPSAFSWAERWGWRFGDIMRGDSGWRPFAVLDDRGERASIWSERTLVPLRQDATVVFWSDTAPLSEVLTADSV